MKERFDFNKGQVVKEYEVGDIVDVDTFGGLMVSTEQEQVLNDVAFLIYDTFCEYPPMGREVLTTIINIIEYKIGRIDEEGGIEELRETEKLLKQ